MLGTLALGAIALYGLGKFALVAEEKEHKPKQSKKPHPRTLGPRFGVDYLADREDIAREGKPERPHARSTDYRQEFLTRRPLPEELERARAIRYEQTLPQAPWFMDWNHTQGYNRAIHRNQMLHQDPGFTRVVRTF